MNAPIMALRIAVMQVFRNHGVAAKTTVASTGHLVNLCGAEEVADASESSDFEKTVACSKLKPTMSTVSDALARIGFEAPSAKAIRRRSSDIPKGWLMMVSKGCGRKYRCMFVVCAPMKGAA
mmetsp:Transcript_43751/g.77452  ORF Transcript_43751/g.77452 Transcript_43751/m.77452 type:complete len:122 (-) Transcript_43751:885-1250(-)